MELTSREYGDEPPVAALADEDDVLDSTGVDFKGDPVSDDEIRSMIDNRELT